MKLHKLIFLATAAALAFPAAAVVDSDPVWNSVKGQPAPVLQVARPADATGTYRPATVSVLPVSDSKIIEVVKQGQMTGDIPSGSSGATPLGTIVGTGSWTNTGAVALMVTVGANDQCYTYTVTTPDGYIVLKDDCEWSSSSTAFVVPGGGWFSIAGSGRSTWNNGLRSNITALGERITWASTGINGLVATPVTKVISSYSDASCNSYQVRETTGAYTITGLTTTRETVQVGSGPCAPPGGGYDPSGGG